MEDDGRRTTDGGRRTEDGGRGRPFADLTLTDPPSRQMAAEPVSRAPAHRKTDIRQRHAEHHGRAN